MFDIDAIAADLCDDGDTHRIDDADETWTFRLRIEPDDLQVSDMEDPEVFGRYECREYGRGDRNRPDGFTGAAVKFDSDSSQGFYFWYEPPADFRRFKGSGFPDIETWEKAKAQNLKYVRNLLSWGYISIGVEATNVRVDGYTRTWTSGGIGGVESGIGLWGEAWDQHNAYVAELVKEQLGEVVGQITEERQPA